MIPYILLLSAVILCLIYINGKYNELYWKKRNVAFYAKNKVTGVFWEFLLKDKAIFENLCEVYKEFHDEPAVGIGSFLTPTLYIIDPNNIQHVLATDFNSFSHLGFELNESDTLANNVFFMNGNRWKLMRQTISPLFTSAKLKSMYYIMDKSAVDFVSLVKENNELWRRDDTFDTLSSFCSAAIAGAVFGLNTGSIFDSPFLDMARNAFKPTLKLNAKFAMVNLSNSLFKLFRVKLFKDHEYFFIRAVKQILRAREQEVVKKHDFPDLCVSLQNSGKIIDKDTGFELMPTDELLAAQAFFFFMAGVEPTASCLFGTLVELGKDPEYLQKVHNEIDEMFTKYNNKMCYDAIMEMNYLDMAISEALRLHPPVGFLNKRCVKDTVLPVGNIKVEKGTKILTPIFELHHDSKYYPEPEKFVPERFAPENRHNIPDTAYMPFGKGNRICLGKRYALLQAKAGIVHLLRDFTVSTKITGGGMKYMRQPATVRLGNIHVEFIPRQS